MIVLPITQLIEFALGIFSGAFALGVWLALTLRHREPERVVHHEPRLICSRCGVSKEDVSESSHHCHSCAVLLDYERTHNNESYQ